MNETFPGIQRYRIKSDKQKVSMNINTKYMFIVSSMVQNLRSFILFNYI
jgi:hypothetical protein